MVIYQISLRFQQLVKNFTNLYLFSLFIDGNPSIWPTLSWPIHYCRHHRGALEQTCSKIN